MQTSHARSSVAIAGANGFVGRALIEALGDRFRIIGLTRQAPESPQRKTDRNVEWRSCDLYSMRDVEAALEGADYAVYLVHSMTPSARLTQAKFEDLDMLLADNFARAAETQGLKQIIFLGGIVPRDVAQLSDHLRSRLEVELTLVSRNTPVTAIRAGLIVGPGGSSFAILEKLVRRLPMMVCPLWTESKTQPVALQDVIQAMQFSIGNERMFNRSADIAGPEVMTYREMLRKTARALGKRRWLITLRIMTADLSKLWVSIFSGVSLRLVSPLIDSLRHDMVAHPDPMVDAMQLPQVPFEEAVRDSAERRGFATLFQRRRLALRRYRRTKEVRSVQRLVNPAGKDTRWVAMEYCRWLPRFMRPFLNVTADESGDIAFCVRFPKIRLLQLTLAPDRSAPDRQLFYITGGVLAHKPNRGRLEFRQVMNGQFVIAAIHEFEPALPWYIYNYTQAVVHLWVMRGFGRHLAEYDRRNPRNR